jgi:hypothetical protein
VIRNEDHLLAELEAAPTLWAAADAAERLAKTGTNPLYGMFERVLRRFALITWPKKPRGRKGDSDV